MFLRSLVLEISAERDDEESRGEPDESEAEIEPGARRLEDTDAEESEREPESAEGNHAELDAVAAQ